MGDSETNANGQTASPGGSSGHNLLTVKETAEYLRIPVPTVYYLVQRGQLPAVQIGGRWRIKRDALDRDVLKNEEHGQPTVLVVDDDSGIQAMFKLFLKKAGYSRMVVGTGKEAMAALHKQHFDLCFLDLQLPDSTGDEIYRFAKQADPQLPIVIITGFPDSELLDNILKYGPVTVLKKPLRIDDLVSAFRQTGHRLAEEDAA
jgi:excisionase family DNA binding protein